MKKLLILLAFLLTSCGATGSITKQSRCGIDECSNMTIHYHIAFN